MKTRVSADSTALHEHDSSAYLIFPMATVNVRSRNVGCGISKITGTHTHS